MTGLRPKNRRSVPLIGILLAWLVLGLAEHQSLAAEPGIDIVRATKVKAAAFKEIIRYTEWPVSAFEDASAPIEVLMIGHDKLLEETIRQLLSVTTLHDRRLEFAAIDPADQAKDPAAMTALRQRIQDSHAVYIAESERARLELLLRGRGTASVLMVGDSLGFAAAGGMIGFGIQEGRLAIEANLEEIRKAGLTVSSQALRLARIVFGPSS